MADPIAEADALMECLPTKPIKHNGVWLEPVETIAAITDLAESQAEALRLALPVMRDNVAEYAILGDGPDGQSMIPVPKDFAPDFDAILAAEACVGRIPDAHSDWLDPILDAQEWRQG